jgi:hypothetical protein
MSSSSLPRSPAQAPTAQPQRKERKQCETPPLSVNALKSATPLIERWTGAKWTLQRP